MVLAHIDVLLGNSTGRIGRGCGSDGQSVLGWPRPLRTPAGFAFQFSLVFAILAAGCRPANVEPAAQTSVAPGPAAAAAVPPLAEPGSRPAESTAAGPTRQPSPLAGIWLGVAVVDGDLLEQKLASLDEDARQQLLKIAETFLSTLVAIEFAQDGSMEMDVEITPWGADSQRAAMIGTWRVVEVDQDRYVVESREELADGTVETSTMGLRLMEDGEHMTMVPATAVELAECRPLIIFQRQSRMEPAGQMARQPAETPPGTPER